MEKSVPAVPLTMCPVLKRRPKYPRASVLALSFPACFSDVLPSPRIKQRAQGASTTLRAGTEWRPRQPPHHPGGASDLAEGP